MNNWQEVTQDIPDIEALDNGPYSYNNPDIEVPRCIYRVAPEYPKYDAKLGIQGATQLRCIINRDGHPEDIEVIRSLNSRCDGAAMEALRQWRFKPATMNGVPVAVIMEITVHFKLR